jgi:hypothetical protein
MSYYVLEPEVAGNIANHSVGDLRSRPPKLERVHYEFDGWLGDELVESVSTFVVTEAMGYRLSAANLTGFSLRPCETSRSELFQDLHAHRKLPAFSWLCIQGTPGLNDFGISEDGRLVASSNAFAVLQQGHLKHCEITVRGA